MAIGAAVGLAALLLSITHAPVVTAKEQQPKLDFEAVPSASRAAYAEALREAYGGADAKKKENAKAMKARARKFQTALKIFDGHAPVHHSVGVIYGQLAAKGGKVAPEAMRKARHHFKLAVEKLEESANEFRAIYAANYAQAVYGVDAGPGMAHVKAALRLCVPEGGDTWPLPGPCKQIAEQLRLKSLEEIDADEL